MRASTVDGMPEWMDTLWRGAVYDQLSHGRVFTGGLGFGGWVSRFRTIGSFHTFRRDLLFRRLRLPRGRAPGTEVREIPGHRRGPRTAHNTRPCGGTSHPGSLPPPRREQLHPYALERIRRYAGGVARWVRNS